MMNQMKYYIGRHMAKEKRKSSKWAQYELPSLL
jgi:hypothetical protein